MLIELEAPDVDAEVKTESLADSGVRGYEVREGMSSYLDFREPHGLHLRVGALASLRPWRGGGQMLLCGGRGELPGGAASLRFPGGWHTNGHSKILFYFFHKVLLPTVFFFSAHSYFQAYWDGLILFIESLLHAQHCAEYLLLCFDDF